MAQNPQKPVRRKPAGGVRAVLIASAERFIATFSDDGTKCSTDDGPETMIACPLIDDRSSFDERLEIRGGVKTVTHTLKLVADRDAAGRWFHPSFIHLLRHTGVVARIEMGDGRHLIAGTSANIPCGHPLKLRSIEALSGCSNADRPTAVMVLQCTDDAFAAEIDNN